MHNKQQTNGEIKNNFAYMASIENWVCYYDNDGCAVIGYNIIQ